MRAAFLCCCAPATSQPNYCFIIQPNPHATPRLSKSFSDLIGAFIFGLYPIPFCGDFTGVPCTAEADSTSQFYYAGGLLLFAALLKHLAESSKSLQGVPGIESVPGMVSMIGPWAVGAAFNKVRAERPTRHQKPCVPPLVSLLHTPP